MSSTAPFHVSPATRRLAGLALAVPAAILLHVSFTPHADRLELRGTPASATFDLPASEPLVLEFEVVVSPEGAARTSVTLTLNGRPVTSLREVTPFLTHRGSLDVPAEVVRPGANVLGAVVDGPGAATLAVQARVHNYRGIAPDVPRAVVVSDAAVAHRRLQRSPGIRAIELVILIVMAMLTVRAALAIGRPRSPAAARAQLASMLLVPWLAVAWSLATPRHLWVAVETLAAMVAVPWLLVLGVSWAGTHRAAVGKALAITAITVVLLEGVLRLVNYVSPSFVFYSESYARYRGQPGERVFDAQFNSRGFNDVERGVARPAGIAFRCVAIGDSFLVGVVPQRANFLRLLESALGAIAPTEVVNLGVSGTGPSDYLSLLVDEGLAYAPDLVLVGFFVGNDFELRARRLHEYSYGATLVRALWRLRTIRTVVEPFGRTSVDYVDEEPGMTRSRFMEVQVDRSWIYERNSVRLPAAAARAGAALRDIRDLSRRAGADMLVAILPDESQVDVALQAQLAEALGRPPADLDFDQPTRVIARALGSAGITTIDLLPAFRVEAKRTRLYKPQDTHWNLAGNRLAATVLADALEERVRRARALRSGGG